MFFSCRRPPPPQPSRPHCLFPSCAHRALKCEVKSKGKGILYSLYCKDHACRQRLGDLMCPSHKEPGMAKFCEDHRRCQHQACTNQRICADTSQDWPYCQKHTCFLQGCHQKRGPNSKMCGFHTPMCLIPGCDQPRTETGLYCACHSCHDRDCSAVINGGHWCKDHRTCKTKGCGQSRIIAAGGKYEDVCWQHLPTACQATGCVSVVSGGVRFCAQHECMYPPCRERKDNAADTSRLYCANHTCHQQTCPQPVSNPADPSTAKYCITHTCASPPCNHPSKPLARHCALHACLHPTCPSPRAADPLAVPGVQFCPSHECLAAGCHGPARAEGSFCDAEHACGVPGCPAPRGTGKGDDGCCTAHAAIFAPDFPDPRRSSSATTRHAVYFTATEEALGQRLREERERHGDEQMRRRGEVKRWERHVQAGGLGVDVEAMGRGKRGARRSFDSGIGASADETVSDNCTLVS